jgi:hypothetical protein
VKSLFTGRETSQREASSDKRFPSKLLLELAACVRGLSVIYTLFLVPL